MQLPDECFGRRWAVISSHQIAADATDEWLVKQPLPDGCVLWGLRVIQGGSEAGVHWVKIALGDNEPVSDATFDAFERLFPGDFDNAAEEGAIYFMYPSPVDMQLRMPIVSMGRRFAVQAHNGNNLVIMNMCVVFLISSIPTEVPDCLLSGQGRSL